MIAPGAAKVTAVGAASPFPSPFRYAQIAGNGTNGEERACCGRRRRAQLQGASRAGLADRGTTQRPIAADWSPDGLGMGFVRLVMGRDFGGIGALRRAPQRHLSPRSLEWGQGEDLRTKSSS